MLTAAQRSEFEERGYLHLPRAIPEEDVQSVLDRIWNDLEQRCGIPREKPGQWPEARPKGFNTLTRSGTFEPTCSQTVRDAIDDFLGPGHWEKPNPWGALLLTLPSKGPWILPNNSWHLDLPASVDSGADRIPGVQVFAILEPLAAQGGATVVLSGSHRVVRHLAQRPELIGEGRSRDISKAVKRAAPGLRDLWSRDPGGDREHRYMRNPVDVYGIPVRAVEFIGQPGDVMLMHPWIFHAASPNRGDRPRIVITERVRKRTDQDCTTRPDEA